LLEVLPEVFLPPELTLLVRGVVELPLAEFFFFAGGFAAA